MEVHMTNQIYAGDVSAIVTHWMHSKIKEESLFPVREELLFVTEKVWLFLGGLAYSKSPEKTESSFIVGISGSVSVMHSEKLRSSVCLFN